MQILIAVIQLLTAVINLAIALRLFSKNHNDKD